jgi:hypothetical protein
VRRGSSADISTWWSVATDTTASNDAGGNGVARRSPRTYGDVERAPTTADRVEEQRLVVDVVVPPPGVGIGVHASRSRSTA